MPRTRFSRASIFAARSGNGGRTFEFRFTREMYPISFINSRFVLPGNARVQIWLSPPINTALQRVNRPNLGTQPFERLAGLMVIAAKKPLNRLGGLGITFTALKRGVNGKTDLFKTRFAPGTRRRSIF